MSPGSTERGVQLLLNELDCAEAMAGLANFAIDFENFRRTYNNARQHYELVVAQLLQLHLPPERILEIHRRLSHLNIWLSMLGPTFQSSHVPACPATDEASSRHDLEM